MRIATDIDGVLADFAAGWIGRYNRQFRAGLQPVEVRSWDAIVTATAFTSAGSFLDWLDGLDRFWEGLAPVPGAVEAVDHLRSHGHELVAVTQRRPASRRQTEAWLGRHFGGMEVYLVQDKTVIEVDLAVDDSPEVLAQLAGAGTPAIRFARPWNEGAPGIPAHSWPQVVDLVAGLEGRAPVVGLPRFELGTS